LEDPSADRCPAIFPLSALLCRCLAEARSPCQQTDFGVKIGYIRRVSSLNISWPSFAMSYISIPNPRPNKFWDSPAFVLKRVRQHQPSPEELAAHLEEKCRRHGVPTAVDRWISESAGLGCNSASLRASSGSSAQAMPMPTLANILEDLVECQLSTTETEVSSSLHS